MGGGRWRWTRNLFLWSTGTPQAPLHRVHKESIPLSSPLPPLPHAETGECDVTPAGYAYLTQELASLGCGVVVALEGGRPFYAQDRIGQGGRVFRMWKLRSMVVDAEARRSELLDGSDRDGLMFKMHADADGGIVKERKELKMHQCNMGDIDIFNKLG